MLNINKLSIQERVVTEFPKSLNSRSLLAFGKWFLSILHWILAIIIWKIVLRWIRGFWLVLSWSGFCHTDRFHGNGHMLCIFLVRQIQTTKRKRSNTLIFAKKLPKRLIFYRAYNKNEEHKYSRSEFYYPEDLMQRLTRASANVKTIL